MRLTYVLAAIGLALCCWGIFVSGTRYVAASESERAVHVLMKQDTAIPKDIVDRLADANVKLRVQEVSAAQKNLTDEVLRNFSNVLSGVRSHSLQDGALWLVAGFIFSIVLFRAERARRS
jgi:hypothetical protein